MRVVMLTYGSRGDVQPFVALGVGLRAAGHEPVLAAPATFAALAARHQITFAPLPGDVNELARRIADEARGKPLRLARIVYQFARPIGAEVIRRMRRACAGADMVISSFLTVAAGHLCAQEAGSAECAVDLFPFFAPPDDIASIMWPGVRMGLRWRRLSHRFAQTVFRFSQSISYRIVRRQHPKIGPPRLPWAMPGQQIPLLLAYSRHLVPPSPAPLAVQTGAWRLAPVDWQPPHDLVAFLADGPPPVVVSFGSMMTRDADTIGAIVVAALCRLGQRAIVQRGWSNLAPSSLPSTMLLTDELPHDWLLPQAAAMIHHGGAGTTAAALQAGIPAVIVPFAADQPFWAWRAQLTGANPPPIPVARLSVERLSAALAQALTPMYRERAAAVGAAMRAEGGVEEAVRWIERWGGVAASA